MPGRPAPLQRRPRSKSVRHRTGPVGEVRLSKIQAHSTLPVVPDSRLILVHLSRNLGAKCATQMGRCRYGDRRQCGPEPTANRQWAEKWRFDRGAAATAPRAQTHRGKIIPLFGKQASRVCGCSPVQVLLLHPHEPHSEHEPRAFQTVSPLSKVGSNNNNITMQALPFRIKKTKGQLIAASGASSRGMCEQDDEPGESGCSGWIRLQREPATRPHFALNDFKFKGKILQQFLQPKRGFQAS